MTPSICLTTKSARQTLSKVAASVLVALLAALNASAQVHTERASDGAVSQVSSAVLSAEELRFASLVARQLVLAERQSSWGTPASVTSVFIPLIALFSLGFTLYQFQTNRQDQIDSKLRELQAARKLKLLESLLWFNSGLHARSAGIALIEGHWSEFPDLRDTWASAMISEATAIVTKSDTTLVPDDQRDLQRLLALVHLHCASIPEGTALSVSRRALQDALLQLPTRVVLDRSGSPVSPLHRKSFIKDVEEIASRYTLFEK